MAIAADLIRGHTDTIILAQLTHGDSYGYNINRVIQRITGGQYELKEATLYTAFRRLEQSGLIVSYWGTRTRARAGGTIQLRLPGARITKRCFRTGSIPEISSSS